MKNRFNQSPSLMALAVFGLLVSNTAFATEYGRSLDEYMGDFNSIGSAVISFTKLFSVGLIALGVYKFKKHSDSPGQHTKQSAMFTLTAGLLMMIAQFLLNSFNSTLFGDMYSAGNEGAYLGVGAASINQISNSSSAGFIANNPGVQIFVGFSMVIGLLYFVKGILMIHEMGNGNSGSQARNKAITHLVGGAIAFNVTDFACVLANTFGFGSFCS